MFAMTTAQTKAEIVSWIEGLDDESVLSQVDAIRKATQGEEVPEIILTLLRTTLHTPEDQLIPHTSTRDVLGR